MNFISALRIVFQDKRLIIKLLYLFAISFFYSLILAIIEVVVNVATFFNPNLVSNLGLILIFGVGILTLPLWLYLQGYKYRIAQAFGNGNPGLPEHDNFRQTVEIGGYYLTFNYALTLPFIVVSMIPLLFGTGFLNKFLSSGGLPSVIGIISSGFFAVVAVSFAFFVISNLIVPIMMFSFFKTRSYREAFSLKNFRDVIARSWSDWLLFLILNIFIVIFFIIIRVFGWATIILIPFVSPMLEALSIIISGAMLGSIYMNLSFKD